MFMEFGMNTVSLWCALQVANEEQSGISMIKIFSTRKPLHEISQNHDPSKNYLQTHGTVHGYVQTTPKD